MRVWNLHAKFGTSGNTPGYAQLGKRFRIREFKFGKSYIFDVSKNNMCFMFYAQFFQVFARYWVQFR